MATPQVIFGAGGIGKGNISYTWTTPESTVELLENTLKPLNIKQLDSAASYPPGAPWTTETLLGQAKAVERDFLVDTKILVSRALGCPDAGSLSESNIDSSLAKSLELLGVDSVNILYVHTPDPITPIAESARAFDKHFRAGKFKELGLCNYDVARMKAWLTICEAHGYVKPTVFQGQYNPIYRRDEADLFPFLRAHGFRINAFGPLAGGFLTGKLSLQSPSSQPPPDLSTGRWAPGKFPIYPQTFDKPELHAAIRKFHAVCEASGLTMVEVSLRWIMHHSALREGDGVILGATRVDQLEGSVEACRKGRLPGGVVEAVERLWEDVRGYMGVLFG